MQSHGIPEHFLQKKKDDNEKETSNTDKWITITPCEKYSPT